MADVAAIAAALAEEQGGMMQRYSRGGDGVMSRDDRGAWVRVEEVDDRDALTEQQRQGLQREVERLKAEAEVREALLKDAYELLGKATSEPLGLAALRALVVDRAVAYVADSTGQAMAKLREAADAYRGKVAEVMGEPHTCWRDPDPSFCRACGHAEAKPCGADDCPQGIDDEPVARMHKFASEYE